MSITRNLQVGHTCKPKDFDPAKAATTYALSIGGVRTRFDNDLEVILTHFNWLKDRDYPRLVRIEEGVLDRSVYPWCVWRVILEYDPYAWANPED